MVVLLAQDLNLLRLMAEILSHAGWQTLEFRSIHSFLEGMQTSQQRISALVVDFHPLSMPDRDVIEMLNGLSVPILALRPFALDQVEQSGLVSLSKPFQANDLIQSIKGLASSELAPLIQGSPHV